MTGAAAHAGKAKTDLTKGPVAGHLARLTVPMVWGLLAVLSFQLVDTYYISLLGAEALTAFTFTFPVTFAIFSLTLGLSIATSSVISRQIGRGNPARVRRLTTHILILAFLSGFVMAAAGYLLMDPVFRAMGASTEMMPLIRDYMVIWFAGSIFINTPVVGNAAIRAAGNSFFPAMVMVISAVINAAVAPVLIFGLLGFPRLEMQGAAIAVVFANACALLAGFYFLAARQKMLTRSRRHMRLFGDSAKRLFFVAVPVGLTTVIQPVTNAVIIALLARQSHDAVAAFGIVLRVEAFAFVIIMALATGMAPIIGQNWGARQYDRVHNALRQAIGFCCLWSAAVAAVLFIFARPIASLFSGDEGIVAAAVLYFRLVPASFILGNLVQGWSTAFNAMGLAHRSFVMIFTRLVLINIPLAAAGAELYGAAGVFGAIALTNLLTGAGFHLWNRGVMRRQEEGALAAGA